MMKTLAYAAAIVAAGVTTTLSSAFALDSVSFGTNWLAEAEHGGFYQAVADGTYEKYGLKVTIRQGGPQAANCNLLIAGKIEFCMAGNMLEAFDAVKAGAPAVAVGAAFQKDPQALVAHKGQGYDTFADLAKAPSILMAKDGFISFFQWMKSTYPGFKDSQYKPYTFSQAPFIADKKVVQQAYLTSEPYEIEKESGEKPSIFLLADNGFDTYSTLIMANSKLVSDKPDVAKRFVEASIIGWYNYLYGDNKLANDLIKKDNPDMTDPQIAFSIAKMKEYGIVESGEALDKGIGCMIDAHVKSFFDKMVAAKVVDGSVDYKKSYDAQFVCKGLGMNLKK